MDEAYFTQRPRFSSRLGVVVKRHPALTARVAIKMLQVRAASAVKVLRVMHKRTRGGNSLRRAPDARAPRFVVGGNAKHLHHEPVPTNS